MAENSEVKKGKLQGNKWVLLFPVGVVGYMIFSLLDSFPDFMGGICIILMIALGLLFALYKIITF